MIKVLVAIICIITLSIFGAFVTMNYINPYFSSVVFCEREGYDVPSISGGYSEMYGIVECQSCYGGDCIKEEFKVKKIWTGSLKVASTNTEDEE